MPRNSSDAGTNGSKPPSSSCSERFLSGLSRAGRVTFVSHVHPDPDSLGSMLGLAHLVESRLHKKTRLTQDGAINRAENQAMVDLLDIDLVPIENLSWRQDDALVMVDCQPGMGRHTFDPTIPIYAVLDHHETPGDVEGIPFVDIRRQLGATCSLVTNYLMEQQVAIPPRVATALLYGIETELNGHPREASPLDDEAIHYLYPLADKDLLARIRHAPLPHCYYECILQALQNSFVYDRLIISWVNDLPHPELAAQVVDFLIRLEDVEWAMCVGVCGDRLILSLRTNRPGAHAGALLRQAVGRLGRAGGHARRAGGVIVLPSTSASAIAEMQSELRRRLLRVLHIEECRGQRLVPRRELLQNLAT
jgi:nanoRNase/pAp phosphatase (c-di-AMP/oligoRNAs hydrolase)